MPSATLSAPEPRSLCLRPLGLLDDAEVEMASVLRINRPFMEYMRKNFGKIARQKHGVTLTHQRGGGSSLGRVVA